MKKLFMILIFMFLVVTSVHAQEDVYGSIINSRTPKPDVYEEIMSGSQSINRNNSDTSWLTKRWVDSKGRCLIKGNISYRNKDKIYHIPGWKDYDVTVIDTKYGERWFCTEWEAYQAGWRAPYYSNRPKVYPNPYK